MAAMRGEIRVFSVTPLSVIAGRQSGGCRPVGSALQPVASDLDWCAVVEICQAFLCPFLANHPKQTARKACAILCRRAVAQLVEQRSPKPQVAGSSPVRPAAWFTHP